MMKVFKGFFAVLASVALSLTFVVGFVSQASANTVGTPEQELRKNAVDAAVVFDEHNKARKAAGMSPLVLSTDLSLGLSQVFTNKLASSGSNEIYHNTRTELNKWGTGVGENVAMYGNGNGAVVHGMWMNSKAHKANILNPNFTVMSIGYASNSDNRYFVTVNFYISSNKSGKTYKTGSEWLASFESGPKQQTPSNVNVYLTPGEHFVNGRNWRTECEAYSQTQRCRTEIWATQIVEISGSFIQKNGWVFNNLTYAPSDRELWNNNPLAANGVTGGKVSWTAADGREWRTECDTAVSGRNGCRSYSVSTVITYKNGSFHKNNEYVFNNIVTFN